MRIFIGKVGTKRRAEFELRSRKFRVEEVVEKEVVNYSPKHEEPPSKKRKIGGSPNKPIAIHDEGSTTEGETDEATETEDELPRRTRDTPPSSPVNFDGDLTNERMLFQYQPENDIIWVIRVDWLEKSIAMGHILPIADCLIYQGKVLQRPVVPHQTIHRNIRDFFPSPTAKTTSAARENFASRPEPAQEILNRATTDASKSTSKSRYQPHKYGLHHGSHRFEGKTFTSSAQKLGHNPSQTAHLLQQTTSEYEGTDSDVPEAPDWVKRGVKYACQRFTPPNGPNEEFIGLLKKIRTARTLIDDEIGVRAYSTIIASVAAYPYQLSHPREIIRLPGCDTKVANLWVEYKNTGKLQAVEDYDNDEAMRVLRIFYEIWGVGAKTARHFYYNNHWTELDDIIEFGWNDLDRVQQIGLKYYDEFLDGIPRAEVESIADVVREHAVRARDDRITVTIVGGYRRGKEKSGDVDMIVSHPDLDATAGLIQDIVTSLEASEWITHTLTMSLNNTHRGQHTLPFRTTKASGAGFDTLDKALVVWQDPQWHTREQDLAADSKAKNPNIHRRVDIIIAPWRTVGCAVMGWSGGTTFQRDLRRYAKYTKGWKFDSSGVRSRVTGEVVQLESLTGVIGTPEDAERKVFEGLGIGVCAARSAVYELRILA